MNQRIISALRQLSDRVATQQGGDLPLLLNAAANVIGEVDGLKDQVRQLLELIYSSAEGEICMGYKSDIESIARAAHQITGLNANQIRQKTTGNG